MKFPFLALLGVVCVCLSAESAFAGGPGGPADIVDVAPPDSCRVTRYNISRPPVQDIHFSPGVSIPYCWEGGDQLVLPSRLRVSQQYGSNAFMEVSVCN